MGGAHWQASVLVGGRPAAAGPPEQKPRHPFHLGMAATRPEFHTYLQAAEWVLRDGIAARNLLPALIS